LIKDIEGCLSVPGKWGYVERPKTVTVCALDRSGKEIEITGEGILARALCHEIEHLEGRLFVDKVLEYIDPEDLEEIKKAKGAGKYEGYVYGYSRNSGALL
jgi:peptide deformylase